MPKMGRAWLMLVSTAAWVGACSGHSRSDQRAAAGSPASEPSAGRAVSESAGAGDEAIAGIAEQAAMGGSRASGGAGGSRASGATGGSIVASSGMGGTGGSTDTRNIFIDQIVQGVGGGPPRCLPRSLPVDTGAGELACFIAEFKHGSCDCDQPGRSALSPASALPSLTKYLQNTGICDGASGVSCDSFCACDINQLESADLAACQNEVMPAETVNGYCVVDLMRTDENGAPAPIGNPALVAQCPSNEKRLLRFVGSGEPAHDGTVLIGCWQ